MKEFASKPKKKKAAKAEPVQEEEEQPPKAVQEEAPTGSATSDTVRLDTLNWSASCSCVRAFSLRSARRNKPIFF